MRDKENPMPLDERIAAFLTASADAVKKAAMRSSSGMGFSCQERRNQCNKFLMALLGNESVSYTHITVPTVARVVVPAVVVRVLYNSRTLHVLLVAPANE
ncbi:hypothetical protein [Serratia marcescens]|uniref:hypothetical protein n=1 Tax=Serratia marcescens TaxID=615 RepID=UPI000B95E3F7|nr:hypothetical protein [Serratia marcescens]OYO87996.1 hypothetical protein CHR63_28295 [Serratia marcescens]